MRPSRSAASRSALSTSPRNVGLAAAFSDVGMGVGVKGALQIAQVDEAITVSVMLCECLVDERFSDGRERSNDAVQKVVDVDRLRGAISAVEHSKYVCDLRVCESRAERTLRARGPAAAGRSGSRRCRFRRAPRARWQSQRLRAARARARCCADVLLASMASRSCVDCLNGELSIPAALALCSASLASVSCWRWAAMSKSFRREVDLGKLLGSLFWADDGSHLRAVARLARHGRSESSLFWLLPTMPSMPCEL